VTVQIGYLQWRRDNGFDNDRTPILQNLDGFQNEDALLVPHFHNKARTLKEAQADEHKADASLKFYTERPWPQCDVLVGNSPFLREAPLNRRDAKGAEKDHAKAPGLKSLNSEWFESPLPRFFLCAHRSATGENCVFRVRSSLLLSSQRSSRLCGSRGACISVAAPLLQVSAVPWCAPPLSRRGLAGIDLLDEARQLGCRVTISDEGAARWHAAALRKALSQPSGRVTRLLPHRVPPTGMVGEHGGGLPLRLTAAAS